MTVNQPYAQRVVTLEVSGRVLRRQSRRRIAEVERLYARAGKVEARISEVVRQQWCLVDFITVPIERRYDVVNPGRRTAARRRCRQQHVSWNWD